MQSLVELQFFFYIFVEKWVSGYVCRFAIKVSKFEFQMKHIERSQWTEFALNSRPVPVSRPILMLPNHPLMEGNAKPSLVHP